MYVQESGARVTTRHLLILVAPRRDKPGQDKPPHCECGPRLGVVASRKTGGAVERNRAKRLLREVFRRNLEAFPANTDIVIIVRAGTHELSQDELDREVLSVTPLMHKRKAGKPKGFDASSKPQDGRNRPAGDRTKSS